jgi:hypothetical protein
MAEDDQNIVCCGGDQNRVSPLHKTERPSTSISVYHVASCQQISPQKYIASSCDIYEEYNYSKIVSCLRTSFTVSGLAII